VGVAVGAIVVVAVLAVATAAGLIWRRRNGQLQAARPGDSESRLTGAQVGRDLGERATLLQFSSTFCAPCRATSQLLADLAAADAGVAHIEIDVADRMDLVRLLDIRRTPTTLVLGPEGRIAGRASGLPRRSDVLAALAVAAQKPPIKPIGQVGSDS
jgi:thiol-disulfide isomerase/thioredoxin